MTVDQIRCPDCGGDEVAILANVWMHLRRIAGDWQVLRGDDAPDWDWSRETLAQCEACDHEAGLNEFIVVKEKDDA